MLARLCAAAALIAALCGPAMAQETAPSTAQETAPATPDDATPSPSGTASDLRKVEDESRTVATWSLSVDQVMGRDIHGPDGAVIAEVDSVLEDGGGEIRGVIAEFGGYFFGIGDTEVVVALDQLKPEGDHFTTGLTQDQLSALPAWTD